MIYNLNEIELSNKNIIVENLKNEVKNTIKNVNFKVGKGQINAWEGTIDFFIEQRGSLMKKGISINIPLIFEYLLPEEGARRPDVIMLFKEKVVILEFKNKDKYNEDDILQVINYKNDIINYHGYVHEKKLKVQGYLVLLKGNIKDKVQEIQILNKDNFFDEIDFKDLNPATKQDAKDFIISPYQPLKNILEQIKDLFSKKKLPYIQNLQSESIKETYELLKNLCFCNLKKYHQKRIIFIGGVPGSGKTLIALQFLYNYNHFVNNKEIMEQRNINKEMYGNGAIYISGNGPLVNVLQYQIDEALNKKGLGKAYIKGTMKFKIDYMSNKKVPDYNVILFDEAQRAWDEDKMKTNNLSEADIILEICDKIYASKSNVTLVCFIGDGQSIYEGEEEEIGLWVRALDKKDNYYIYLPEDYKKDFQKLKSNHIETKKELYLDTSIRNNFIDISTFVEHVLNCEKSYAKQELLKLKSKGFYIKVSRNFKKCEEYANKNFKSSKYGMLISSKAKGEYIQNIKKHIGKDIQTYVEIKDSGEWFCKKCTELNIAASEFLCQGLEIDLSILVFAGDYYIKDGKFVYDDKKLKLSKKYKDPNRIMQNTYRVLLTRSRKCMIIYIPKVDQLNETYEFFKDIGVNEI